MNQLRLCIASNDGVTLTAGHLGDAEYLYVYDLSATSAPAFVERRPNRAPGSPAATHANAAKMTRVLALAEDADVLVARRMSPNFRVIAQTSRFQPVVVSVQTLAEALALLQARFHELADDVALRQQGEFSDQVPIFGPTAITDEPTTPPLAR